jgi:hypothetical protein
MGACPATDADCVLGAMPTASDCTSACGTLAQPVVTYPLANKTLQNGKRVTPVYCKNQSERGLFSWAPNASKTTHHFFLLPLPR